MTDQNRGNNPPFANFGTAFAVSVYETPYEAAANGFDYTRWDKPPTSVRVERVVVVRNGTVTGNPTLDFVMGDAQGNQYVTLLTGNLLSMLREVSSPSHSGGLQLNFEDTFNGDDELLIRSIDALLALDAAGAVSGNGIGGHARSLLKSAASRLQKRNPG